MEENLKQLLLIDICARLPYGVIVDNPNPAGGAWDEVIDIDICAKTVTLLYDGCVFSIDDVKPYLRPMSSMTDLEKEECCAIFNNCMYQFEVDKYGDICSTKKTVERENIYYDMELMDKWMKWLNAHHFDYRGLIPMCLAIEAPEGMYK